MMIQLCLHFIKISDTIKVFSGVKEQNKNFK